MKEANLEKQELQKEEVNVYDVNCNQVRYERVTDCIGGSALITPME